MTYRQVIDKIEELANKKYYSQKNLSRIKNFLTKIGNPQENLSSVLVGGTNGKGSVVIYLTAILKEAGILTGTYTSPHLRFYTERMKVNNRRIPHSEFVSLFSLLKPQLEKLAKENEEYKPSKFEILTALALMYFKKKKVDLAAVEVGLGGEIDATNILDALFSVITNVTYDHTNVLGKNLEDIARAKAGIIKKNSCLITSDDKEEVLSILEERCRQLNTQMLKIDKNSYQRINKSLSGQSFNFQSPFHYYNNLFIQMLGEHQIINACMAIVAAELLQQKGFNITASHIKKGIRKAFWEGRLEVIREIPLLVLDGAHNPDAARILNQSLKNEFTYKRLILVIGVFQDKDYQKILQELAPTASLIILTSSTNKRACPPPILASYLSSIGFNNYIIKDTIPEAIKEAFDIARFDDLICVTGSIYTVGEARQLLIADKKKKSLMLLDSKQKEYIFV